MLILWWMTTAGATEHGAPRFPRPRDWTWSRAGLLARTTFLPAAVPEVGFDGAGTILGWEFGLLLAIGYGPSGTPFPYVPQPRDSRAWTLVVDTEYTLGRVLGRLRVGDVAVVPTVDVGLGIAGYQTTTAFGGGLRTGRFEEVGPLVGASLDLWTLRRGHGLVDGWGFRLAFHDRIQPYIAQGRAGVLQRPSFSVAVQAMHGRRWRTRRDGNVP